MRFIMRIAIMCAALFALFVLCAASTPSGNVEISIRYFDKRIYYADPGSEIPVKITILNLSSSTYRFKLAEDRMFSVSFKVFTAANREIPYSVEYLRALSTSAPVYYREIAIQPGEEYSFVEDVAQYSEITEPGMYVIDCLFYPELFRPGSSMPYITSNKLQLSIRPAAGVPVVADARSEETGEILKPEKLPPDEVVRRMLVARQKGRWAEFFLYIDVEKLMLRNPDKKRIYDRASDENRQRMVEEYKTELMLPTSPDDISLIPDIFEIIQTTYSGNTGYVTVKEKFLQKGGFYIVKEYTYELKKIDDIWYIVGYTVRNLGTE